MKNTVQEPKNLAHCQASKINIFYFLKHTFFIQTSYTTIIKHVWIKNINKYHENHAKSSKFQNWQLKTAYKNIKFWIKIYSLNTWNPNHVQEPRTHTNKLEKTSITLLSDFQITIFHLI